MKKCDEIWIEIGIRSFARFHALGIEEVKSMSSNPNNVFQEMVEDMFVSLRDYEDFMVKIKKMDEKKEEMTRLDILDL